MTGRGDLGTESEGFRPDATESTMLVLTRKIGERIVIANNIVVEVMAVQGQRIRLGIQAPPEITIMREGLIHADTVVESTEPQSAR